MEMHATEEEEHVCTKVIKLPDIVALNRLNGGAKLGGDQGEKVRKSGFCQKASQ